jgi:hypothetical protein
MTVSTRSIVVAHHVIVEDNLTMLSTGKDNFNKIIWINNYPTCGYLKSEVGFPFLRYLKMLFETYTLYTFE